MVPNGLADWGRCYLDHYEANLKSACNRETFRPKSEHEYSIQILGFDRVFPRCRVFASLGLSHYSKSIGEICEVVLPSDSGWDEIPRVLANALFYIVQKKMRMGRGVAVGGISDVLPEFSKKCGKTAVYFTLPYGFPNAFDTVSCGSDTGKIYLAMLITSNELNYFEDHGAEKFEDILEKHSVDPFSLSRSSAL